MPAGLFGVVGVKPTFDAIPTEGLVRLSRLDHIGPIARTVEDAALLLEALGVRSGRTPSTTTMNGLRVGVVETDPGLVDEIAGALDSAEALLREAGAKPQSTARLVG